MTDFQKLILDLVESGMAEAEIAKAVGVSQPTINRVKSGKQKNIGYALGAALIKMHAELPNHTVQQAEA